jgi:hypothetical protein
MKLKRTELSAISKATQALVNSPEVKSKKLIYTLIKNGKVLEPEVEAIQKAFESDSEEHGEFQTKLRDVYFKYGEVDPETGNLKTEGNGFILKDEKEKPAVEKEIKKLEKKYKDAIEAREKEIEDYKKFLEEETEVNLLKIKFDDLPEEISAEIMYILDTIIEAPQD